MKMNGYTRKWSMETGSKCNGIRYSTLRPGSYAMVHYDKRLLWLRREFPAVSRVNRFFHDGTPCLGHYKQEPHFDSAESEDKWPCALRQIIPEFPEHSPAIAVVNRNIAGRRRLKNSECFLMSVFDMPERLQEDRSSVLCSPEGVPSVCMWIAWFSSYCRY